MDLGTNFTQKLEPFLLMSKSAKGAAAAKLIQDATSAAGVYVFAELLELPNIRELASSEQHAPYFSLLELFAYRTYEDYLQHQNALPALNPTQITKLKHLTLVSLSMDRRILPYKLLLDVLQISSIRELEDLIIDAIYLDIIRGKLDQKEQQFDVEYTMGRDLEPGKIENLLVSLQSWASTTSAVLATLDNKLASLATDAASAKTKHEAYDAKYQVTLKEVLDKQKEAKANLRQQAYPGRTGLTAAGKAELERERARQSEQKEKEKEREREKEEKQQQQQEETDKDKDSMDVDDADGKGKNRKPPQEDVSRQQQRKRNRS